MPNPWVSPTPGGYFVVNERLVKFLVPVLSLLLAFGIGGILIVSVGKNPLEVYGYLFSGPFSNLNSFGETLVKATPLIFTALATIFAYRSGVFNIGGEGQVVMGAVASIAFTLRFTGTLPGPVILIISLLLGILAGGVWGLIPGVLKALLNINEVIVCIAFNYIAILFMNYLCSGPMKEKVNPQTPQIAESVRLPRILPGTRVHLGIVIAVVTAVAFYYFLFHTAHGFKLRVVGLNPQAAFASGYKIRTYTILTMFVSGAVAGLAGSVELHGVGYRLMAGFCADYGYNGISIALISQLNPLGSILVAYIFSVLRAGSSTMQIATGIPTSIVEIIQALVIFFVIAGTTIINYDNFKPALERFAQKWRPRKARKEGGAG